MDRSPVLHTKSMWGFQTTGIWETLGFTGVYNTSKCRRLECTHDIFSQLGIKSRLMLTVRLTSAPSEILDSGGGDY
jgi:hypothetical protein